MRLEGDDAVHVKTGLIFVRPLEFESVTFFGKLFQPIKSQDSIGRIFDVQLKCQTRAFGNCSLDPGGFPNRWRLETPILGGNFPHFGTKCAVSPKTGAAL